MYTETRAHIFLATQNKNTVLCCLVSHREVSTDMFLDMLTIGLFSGHTVFKLAFSVVPLLALIRVCVWLCICTFLWDSRCVLRLLVRLGDLPVAVDHLYQQPEGQEHQQHIHHDLRVERCGVLTDCGAQTTARNMHYSVCILLSECNFILNRAGQTYLFTGLRKYAELVHVCATLLTHNQLSVIIEKAIFLTVYFHFTEWQVQLNMNNSYYYADELLAKQSHVFWWASCSKIHLKMIHKLCCIQNIMTIPGVQW